MAVVMEYAIPDRGLGFSPDLEGRVVIITGAGQGIGRIYAHRMAEAGAIPVIAEIDEGRCNHVSEEIRSAGRRCLAFPTDVANRESVESTIRHTLESTGRIDVLVNNAAIYSRLSRGTFDTLPLQEWDDVLRTNVTGAFLCARAVLPAMRRAKWGRIVHISSSTVLLGRPNFLHYVTSKAALIGMTRAMARELGPDGITVNSILPGLTKTEIDAAGVTEQVWQTIIDRQCIKRSEVPDDIASVLLFLASSASGFITGQSIVVDGGAAYS
jgi:NAD(P)-dependent dehydrogenase (short-subunit alcohol dehydrogenase family)